MKRVFIASSNDLAQERKDLALLLQGEGFSPVLWKNSDHSITTQSYQERLNDTELINSDIVIFMIKRRYGKYTQIEYEFTREHLGKEIDRMYVYFFETKRSERGDKEEQKRINNLYDTLTQENEDMVETVDDYKALENDILKQMKCWRSSPVDKLFDKSNDEEYKKSAIEFLENNFDVKEIQNRALKYIPSDYRNPLSDSISQIIELLVNYGVSPDIRCIPLFCLLLSCYKDSSYPTQLKEYIKSLKQQYQIANDECRCEENSRAVDTDIGVEFVDNKDENPNGSYSIDLWEYSNNSYKRVKGLQYIPKVNIKDPESISKLFTYLATKLRRYRGLYIELILPLDIYEEEIVNDEQDKACGIKKWYIREGRKGKEKSINTIFRFIYRIGERFNEKVEDTEQWRESWNEIKQQESILENADNIKGEEFQESLTSSTNCVVTSNKIKNIIDILDDITFHEVSLALIHLGERVDSRLSKNPY